MKNDATATFLITTARSGTQWLATAVRDAYPDLLRVEHEPVGYRYRPAANLRDRHALDLLLTNPVVAAHFTTIDETLRQGRSYVELGFPAFALYPLLRDRFADRLRIVQLVRHPVPVAASLVTHQWYTNHPSTGMRCTIRPGSDAPVLMRGLRPRPIRRSHRDARGSQGTGRIPRDPQPRNIPRPIDADRGPVPPPHA